MLPRICLYVLCFALFTNISLAQDIETPASSTAERTPTTSLSSKNAIILGVIEGITEYLPVSSTGHLILTNAILGLDADTPVRNHQGEQILIKTDRADGTRPYTIGEAAYAYVIVIQAGAIAAVLLLYWRTILEILLGCFGKNPRGRKLAINLISAFLPAAIIGLLLDDLIERLLGNNVRAVAGALVVGAIVMLIVEKWRKHSAKGAATSEEKPGIYNLSLRQAIMIGFFQCLAMWPGTSRSMATIVGGYLAGLSPKHAAEFSFLLGLITLSAASGYKMLRNGPEMVQALELSSVLLGCVVAFVSSALAVKWLVSYLSKHGLALFAWYRIALALAVFLLLG